MLNEKGEKIKLRDNKAHDTRNRIIEQSFILFTKKNYRSVTLKDILSVTELSKGAFYHHFKSKHELYEIVINRMIDNFLVIPFNEFDKTSLSGFYLNYIDYLQKRQLSNGMSNPVYNTLLSEAVKIIPSVNERIETIKEEEEKVWITIIKNAKKNSEITTDMLDQDIARMFICLASGVRISQMFKPQKDEVSALLKIWKLFYLSLT